MASGNGGKKPVAIGIDLGTTYSCVAIWKHDNRVEIIANDQGKRTTPSCVAFTDTERLIGDDAKNQMSRNHANTVYDAKRLIGRRFSERIVQDGVKTWPFKVVKGRKDIPNIVVNYMGNEKQFSAVEISSMVLSKMKDIAEAYIGDTVKDAVITVPAYFNDSQRQATKDAAKIVGLNVIRMINEPTAAAIAYGVDNMQSLDRNRNVLVFDLGGGTFDVSLLTIGKSGTFDVIAVAGDAHLGGQDFDNNLVNYCVKVFKEKTKKDITKNKKALGKLKSKCEKAKRYLSGATQTCIVLDSLYEGVNLSINITRALFENLNIDLFSMCINKVKSCLRDANTKKTNVDDVILVGGSTRIPKIRSMLQEFFDREKLCRDINPDEAVAYGAAVMAAKVSGQTTKTLHDLVLHDVTPLSLGIKVHGDLMKVLIPRNTSIPTKKTEIFVTTTDNQTFMKTMVYQGERAKASDNYLLGQFTISGIPLAPKGEIEVKDCFEIDANGILTVTSTIGSTGKTKKRTFTNCSGRLSKNEIKKMVEDAEKFKVRDQEYKRKVDANNDLEDCLYGLQKKMKRNDMSPMGVKYLNYVIDNTMNWLEDSKGATFDKIETTDLFSIREVSGGSSVSAFGGGSAWSLGD